MVVKNIIYLRRDKILVCVFIIYVSLYFGNLILKDIYLF